MELILYNATTIDGFIATTDGNSEWVSPVDAKLFEEAVRRAGCIIVGRKTFEQYEGDLYPFSDVLNIVITGNPPEESNYPNVLYLPPEKDEILKVLMQQQQNTPLLVGGGKTNALFLKFGLINKIILSVHPLILGNGIHLFADSDTFIKLKEVSSREIGDNIVQITYNVL